MSSRRINAMLWVGAGVLVALAVLVVAWGVMRPVEEDGGPQVRVNLPATNPAGVAGLPRLEEMAAAFDKPLRRDLIGTGPTTAPVNASANANVNALPVTLVGTIGNSLAMLRMADGKIELKGVGESVAGMTVISIGPTKVEVRYNGKVVALDKQRRG
jgi:hypothetical protein